MRRPGDVEQEEGMMGTLVELTSAFEGIASMRIAQIKDQVLQSTQFFNQLWAIYTQVRAADIFGFGREATEKSAFEKELLILITAEGGFSGDIDQKLVELMVQSYDPAKNEVIVIGHHGAAQLAQRGVSFKKYYRLPTRDNDINVWPLIHEVRRYRSTKVYYQEYVSLLVQDVKRIDLSLAVEETASKLNPDDLINELTYIFEPSTFSVVAHLERSMMQIAISQLILNSKLAQYASRFRAMSASHERADEMKSDLHLESNRARRNIKDQRLKEIVNGRKKSKSGVGV